MRRARARIALAAATAAGLVWSAIPSVAAPTPPASPDGDATASVAAPSNQDLRRFLELLPECPAEPATDPTQLPASPSPDAAPTQLPASPSPDAAPTQSAVADAAPPAAAEAAEAPATCQELRARLAETTQAVIDAAVALQTAQTDLEEAQRELRRATAAVATAQEAHRTAVRNLQRAVAAERVAAARIVELSRAQRQAQDEVGAVARAAYRGGPFSSASIVLRAEDPVDFTDRIDQYSSALRNQGATLAAMAETAADLRNARAGLVAKRAERARLEALSAQRLGQTRTARRGAAEAKARVVRRVAQRSAAVAALEATRKDDLAAYRSTLAASKAVADRLDELAALRTSAGDASTGRAGSGDALPARSGVDFVRPGTGSPTSPFGMRYHPILGYTKLHTGLDLSPGDGFVYAAVDGRVAIARADGAYGNMTVLEHGRVGGQELSTLYAHQARLMVTEGDTVRAGQVIGVVGSTGYSTGRHLHFEVRLDGTPVDPAPYLAGAPYPA
jgi:murein DD-endopeptidase MepM/ murein hydrolase activator NlpD